MTERNPEHPHSRERGKHEGGKHADAGGHVQPGIRLFEVPESRDEDSEETRRSGLSRRRLAHVMLGAEPENEGRQPHQDSGDGKRPAVAGETRLLYLPQRLIEKSCAGRQLGGDATTQYDGRGMCYLEFGHDQVAKVDVTFVSGQMPVGDLEGPSSELARDKVEFGTTRIQRWFGRDWTDRQPAS